MDLPAHQSFLHKPRAIAVALMVVAGAAASLGSFLDWITLETPPLFTGTPSEPFTGVDAGDGWWTFGAGLLLINLGGLLWVTRRTLFAWLGFLTSLVIGGIATADFRGISDVTSPIGRRMNVIGEAKPALGLILVAAAALAGVIASLLGVAATPKNASSEP